MVAGCQIRNIPAADFVDRDVFVRSGHSCRAEWRIFRANPQLALRLFNESFGFAVGYVHGVVGRPQKQATFLATTMAGTKGSAMGFLVGRDLQMPRIERLFWDPVISVGYFKDNDVYIN